MTVCCQGPPLQQQIAAVELRFLRRKVALIGDCKKMFLQVHVHPNDRHFLRFHWHDPDEVHAVPQVYQFPDSDIWGNGLSVSNYLMFPKTRGR